MVEFEIDFYADEPSYVQVADGLRKAILAGRYQPHEPIPSIRDLQQELGLSVGTIRKGIRILVDEGLLRLVPGRGTFVTERKK